MLVSNVDHSGSKLDTDGQVMHRLEALIRELKEQTGFKYNSCLPGIRIFPGKVQTVYENYIVRSISALDLKTEYFRKHNFKDSRIDAVNREVLEDDNPVLLFYYVNTERLKK